VSTCVGEEGLDIGEVDLIICYDSQKSPIRLIQRMGRTGRKRAGRIIILLTEGKEEQSYQTSLAKKKSIYKIITNGSKNFRFYQHNPLMIPKELKPKCHKIFIKIPGETEANKTTEAKSKTKRKSVKAPNSPFEAKEKEKKKRKAKPKKGNQRKSGASAIESDEEKVSCYNLLVMWLYLI
jgi:fanconi anemia group M protein